MSSCGRMFDSFLKADIRRSWEITECLLMPKADIKKEESEAVADGAAVVHCRYRKKTTAEPKKVRILQELIGIEPRYPRGGKRS